MTPNNDNLKKTTPTIQGVKMGLTKVQFLRPNNNNAVVVFFLKFKRRKKERKKEQDEIIG